MKTYIIPWVSFKTWVRGADYLSSSVEMFPYVVSLHIVVKWHLTVRCNAVETKRSNTYITAFEIWHLAVATVKSQLLHSLYGSKYVW
jgi:hypothetical protein